MFLLFKRNLSYCKIPFALSKRVLAFTIDIVIVYLHVQNEEILAYIYLQHYHIVVRQFKIELQTNNQYVSFLFSWKILHFKSFSGHLLKVSLHAHNCSNLVGKMTCMGTLTWMFREMSQSPPILHWIIDEESKTLTKLEMEHWTRHKANYSS